MFVGHFWVNFGYVSHIPPIRIWWNYTQRTIIWCRMTVENFVRIVWTVEKIEKIEKWLFFRHFWTNFGYVSHIPVIRLQCLWARRGSFGCKMTVQKFMKIVWTVFEKFEIFMKRSGEKKRHDWISSQKFFPTPKKYFSEFSGLEISETRRKRLKSALYLRLGKNMENFGKLGKKLEFLKKFFFRKMSQSAENGKGGPFGDIGKFSKKSRTVPKKSKGGTH